MFKGIYFGFCIILPSDLYSVKRNSFGSQSQK